MRTATKASRLGTRLLFLEEKQAKELEYLNFNNLRENQALCKLACRGLAKEHFSFSEMLFRKLTLEISEKEQILCL